MTDSRLSNRIKFV